MNKMNADTYKNRVRTRMVDALQGRLSEDEHGLLLKEIENSADLQQIWKEIQALEGSLHQQKFSYGPFFSAKILRKIQERREDSATELWKSFKWVTLPALAIVTGFLMMIVWENQQLDLDTLAGMEEIAIEDMVMDDWEVLP